MMMRCTSTVWLTIVVCTLSSVSSFTIIQPESSLRSWNSRQTHQRSWITTTFAEDKQSISTATTFSDSDEDDEDEDVLDQVELMGKGAAKAKRGKRKGSSAPGGVTPKVSLAPEEIFYEGPPAITETIVPTISILTVVGIIPAAAAWARQAWVRYKITSRRIRVQSGFNGNEMAEIVYYDITEIRTVKRLFGDGDMVLFLRDGAKFEMRNVPNFEESLEFILKYVSPDVAKLYREKGDVGKNN